MFPILAVFVWQLQFQDHEQHFQHRRHGHRLPLHSHVPQRTAPGQLPGQWPHCSRSRSQTDRFLPHPARMVRIPQGHGSRHLFSPPPRPLFHLPFHSRQGSGTLHGAGFFHPSPPPDPVRTGILLVPHCSPAPASPGLPAGVLHCPDMRQGRRARPGLLPAGGKHACRQGRRDGAYAGQSVPGRGGRELVEQFLGRGRRFL